MKRSSIYWSALVTCALLWSGCAHQGEARRVVEMPEAPVRVAILPEAWLTLTRSIDINGAEIVAERFASIDGLDVRGPEQTARALESESGPCLEEPDCIRHVGSRLGVDWVVVVSIAEFGGSVVLRGTMVRVNGAQQETQQETVQDADEESLTASLRRLGEGLAQPLAPPSPPPGRPLYRRWWLWTVIGTVVAAGGAAIALSVAIDPSEPPNDEEPDAVFTPP